MSDKGYEPPEPHPVSGAVTAWNDGRLIVLVIFKRVGQWAVTQCAHAGREHPPVEPWLGVPAVTWLGDTHEFGRKLGDFIGYSDHETEILEALQPFDPDELRRAFKGVSPLRADAYIDIEPILAISVQQMPDGRNQ